MAANESTQIRFILNKEKVKEGFKLRTQEVKQIHEELQNKTGSNMSDVSGVKNYNRR